MQRKIVYFEKQPELNTKKIKEWKNPKKNGKMN
ncbi:MAG: hypothetical protein QG594_1628 [Bacteroidota bacterium]|nr:hypothetical protein [Bacteroidota bacterium]